MPIKQLTVWLEHNDPTRKARKASIMQDPQEAEAYLLNLFSDLVRNDAFIGELMQAATLEQRQSRKLFPINTGKIFFALITARIFELAGMDLHAHYLSFFDTIFLGIYPFVAALKKSHDFPPKISVVYFYRAGNVEKFRKKLRECRLIKATATAK